MKAVFLGFLFCLFPAADLFAQLYSNQYRVPDQNWQELKSERFRVIYPADYHDEAVRTLSILELEYDDIQELVGGSLRDFPIILNPENDRSNGFVAPLNFRSEIEIAPIISKALNPRSGDWLESVVPHELVHALHFSNISTFSIPGLISIFSPDAARSIHAAAPLGLLEGIAVEHESHNTMPESGRGNYPYFYNQFNALLGTDKEWSMGQLVHISTATTPFNRHYIGGYEFVNWLQNEHGDDAMRQAIEWHHKYPFLGFGLALRRTTGQFPATLYKNFQEQHRADEDRRLENMEHRTDAKATKIPFSSTCTRTSRPVWLDDDTVLFYGRACNRESGFYTHSFSSGETKLLHEVLITGDNNYHISPDRTNLLYARHHVDPFYNNVFRADIHELNLTTGKSERLTRNKRVTSPRYHGDEIFALQTRGQERHLVKVEDGDIQQSIPMAENSSVIEFDVHQTEKNRAAILGRKNGVQALWFESLDDIDTLFARDPDIFFSGGSIFDPAWHPDERRLLFTADHTGTMNIYEYDMDREEVTRLTESRFNAYEAGYSFDGNGISYIGQEKNEQHPFILSTENFVNRTLSDGEWSGDEETLAYMNRPLLNREEEVDKSGWNQTDYSTGLGWLKPRLWVPTFNSRDASGIDEIGLRLESGDRMSRHSYDMEITNFADRFWFDGTYQYSGFYPGFEINVFDSPILTTLRPEIDGEQVAIPLINQQRGAALSVPIPIRLEQNSRFSSLFFEPEYILSRRTFRDRQDARISYSDATTLHTVGLSTTFNFGIRQFTRDVQPNRGVRLFTQTRYGLNDADFTLELPNETIRGGFLQRKGFRGGVTTYISPLKRWNQSLRITAQGITQTDAPVFNNQSLYTDLFDPQPLQGFNNVGILGTRYTIPLTYPDDGGFLIPAYLSNIYLVLFSQTVGDISELSSERFSNSARTVLGAGIRSRFRLSNLTFDLGISIGWEPATDNVTYHIGSF